MNRATKKAKANDLKKGSTIHSGSFMTSYLHDDHTEFNNEMPIASPDALKFDELNEVPVNALKQEEEEMEEDSGKAKETNENAIMSVSERTKGEHMERSLQLKSARNNPEKPAYETQISSSRTISGGLTLNKTNASLKNLIMYIKTAYSNNLTSPKWKNFKGLKLQVVEKIRLNNVIWRTWFEQYGYSRKQRPNKKKPSLLYQFTVNPDVEKAHVRDPKQEGEYWKRRLGSITNEYKKWRTISRQHVKLNEADSPTNVSVKHLAYFGNQELDNQSQMNANKTTATATAAITTNNNNNQNIANNINNISVGLHATGPSYNNFCSSNNNNLNYVDSTQVGGQGFYDGTTYTSANYLCGSSNNNNSSSTFNQTNYLYNQNTGSGLSQNASGHQNQQIGGTGVSSSQPIVYSKQVPFTNRCRSPSPGLFQDIDMFNFSSDTLFGTNYISDHKDPIFGNNPDLFQPDLMHLYPNFDFFNLDYEFDADLTGSNTNQSNSHNSNDPNSYSQQQPQQSQLNQQLSNHSSPNEFVPQSITFSAYKDSSPNNNSSSNTSNSNNQVVSVFGQNEINHGGQYSVLDNSNLTENLYNLANLANAASALPSLAQSSCIDQGLKAQNKKAEFKKVENASKLVQSSGSGATRSTNQNLNAQRQHHQQQLHYQTNLINESVSDHHSSVNGTTSTNTIRNLLAQQQSTHQMSSSNGVTGSQQIPNNIRVSGVYSAISGTQPSQVFSNQELSPNKYHQQQQQLYSTPTPGSSIDGLLSEYQNQVKKSKSIPKISNPEMENNLKYKSQQMSVLLSAVLAPSIEKPNKLTRNETSPEPVKKPKRGRKNSAKIGNEMHPTSDTEPPQTKKSVKQNKSSKRATDRASMDPDNEKLQSNNYPFNQDYLIQPNITNNRQMSTDSLTNSPKITTSSFSRYSSLNSTESTVNETTPRSSLTAAKLADYLNDESSATPISRSRSSSVNNAFLGDQGLTTAEQKRRCNIQNGFDRLQTLVPVLKEPKNSKASKATMLKKTSEYIKELQVARDKRLADLAVYQREIEELGNKVTECQIALPAGGVSVKGGLNKSEVFEKKFRAYVQERTSENWKFYLFSLVMRPLFESFVSTLNTSSREEMERTFLEWQDKYCNLVQLRPVVSNYLRQISKSTSILSDCSKLPEECYIAALTNV